MRDIPVRRNIPIKWYHVNRSQTILEVIKLTSALVVYCVRMRHYKARKERAILLELINLQAVFGTPIYLGLRDLEFVQHGKPFMGLPHRSSKRKPNWAWVY